MNLKEVQGNKCSTDRVLKVKTNGWEIVTITDILRQVKHIYDNENRCYPNGEGGTKFIRALLDYCIGTPLEVVVFNYKLRMK